MTTRSPYLIDPIDNFCAISGHSSLVLDNKLYITTGYAPVIENGTTRIASSPWIRVIDLNEPFNLNRTASVTTILPPSIVPVNIPDNQGASFWWDPASSTVIFTQGGGTVEGGVIRDANLVSFGRPGKSWSGRYNSGNDSFEPWGEIDTPFLGQTGQVSSLRNFFDPVGRKGYIYGGDVVGEGGGQRNQVVTYDAVQQSWTNQTTPYGAFDSVGAAIPFTTTAGDVLGILFGGTLNGTPLSMETIFIHDTTTDNWYRQRTNGSPPVSRGHFCATAIKAPDNTSTQILVFGGFGDGHPSDVFALSLPSFTWIRLEERSPDFLPGPGVRLQPSCDVVNNRFFTIFGGRSLVGGDTANCDIDQNALFMYDLTEREWIIDYDPALRDYDIPEPIYRAIGGNSSGYATVTEPPEGFAEPTMAELFAITTPATTTSSPPTGTETNIPPTTTSAPEQKKANVGGIVGGVVAGLIIVIGALVWLYFRKKKRNQNLPDLPFAQPPPPPPRAEIGGYPAVRPYAVEVDAFPLRPEIMELNGNGILKPHGGPPIELPVMELPGDPTKR
ncbi:hypothetical protein TWF106_007142 [Orbilia oligospora]|uniref:Uncharacterized protein n=1 Tax=Orbilia oligospora TaxID=2813651 RepID=A0A7C8QPK8_ORBOL|nr:hypothetical protein TWF679_008178 [Orbilia oligospora]KAF3219301.1 hypothetical protein TWF106_007142 [Orbilia oligospora]